MIIASFIVPTLVEYISGYMLEKYFGKSYWDYKDIKYNFQGIICLRFSLAWIALAAFTLFALQPAVSKVYLMAEGIFGYVSMILIVYIFIDFGEIAFNNFYKK